MAPTSFDPARRRALAALAGAACALATGAAGKPASATPIGTAVVFGDAFSVPTFATTSTWIKQMADRGVLTVVRNSAKAGSFASTVGGTLSIRGQVDAYLAARPTLPTFSIVYFGTEDLQRGKSVAAALANYQRAVDSLVAAGANAGSRRLVLVQVHDTTYDPGVTARVRPSVVEFNRGVQRIVAARPGVRTVNLGALFDRVIADPARFGLSNVTTPNAAASRTTALYFDPFRFGDRGHALIRYEVQRVLAAPR